MYGRAIFLVGSHVSRHAKPGATLQNHTFQMLLTLRIIIIIIMICALHIFPPTTKSDSVRNNWDLQDKKKPNHCYDVYTTTLAPFQLWWKFIAVLLCWQHNITIWWSQCLMHAFISFGSHAIISCFHIIWSTCNSSIKTVKSHSRDKTKNHRPTNGSIFDKM